MASRCKASKVIPYRMGSRAALGTFRVFVGRHKGCVGLKSRGEGGPKEVRRQI